MEESRPRKRRPQGEGSIDEVRPGRFRVRVPAEGGERIHAGVYPDEAKADDVRVATLQKLHDKGRAAVGTVTFAAWGRLVLDRREKRGIADVDADGDRFEKHLASAHFATWPLTTIRRADIRRWRDEMLAKRAAPGNGHKRVVDRPIGRGTVVNALNLLRQIFDEAVEDEVIQGNPARDVKVERRSRTHEPWTYLTPPEQVALIRATPETNGDRFAVALGIFTGLRLEEQWLLHVVDVHLDGDRPYLVVRYGSRRKGQLHAPKNGRVREVELNPMAVEVLRAWLPRLAELRHGNPVGLVFPGARGGFRARRKAPEIKARDVAHAKKRTKVVDGFRFWVRAAGITRRVRWHDLRHTCGSSLVAGWWGRPWRLEEVMHALGHSTIQSTERYAHLAPSVIAGAARQTSTGLPSGLIPPPVPYTGTIRSPEKLLPWANP